VNPLRKEETETILRFDAVDECWYAWSSIPKHINSMKKRNWIVIEEFDEYVKLKAPHNAVQLCNAKKSIRKSMSEEQKEAMRKRLAAAREMKKIET
jgi:hypothetical protein